MSRHVTYRGVTLDMDSIRRENEHVSAIGNQKVNARGDQIAGRKITKTADQIARENRRVKTTVVSSSLKGDMPVDPQVDMEFKNPIKTTNKSVARTKEVELPSGDIIIQDKTEGKKK